MSERNLQYLSEILQTIRSSSRPLEHDANPKALEDSWTEVESTVKEMIAKQNAGGPADNIKAITDKVGDIFMRKFPKAELKEDNMNNDGLILFKHNGNDYCSIKIDE